MFVWQHYNCEMVLLINENILIMNRLIYQACANHLIFDYIAHITSWLGIFELFDE